jgi:hypothetical protein
MALLVSSLLLVASAGLLLETTANTQNVIDSTSEQQALGAAESGIQAAVNVLRNNVTLPDDRLIETDRNLAMCASSTIPIQQCNANRIDYIKALDVTRSNLDPDGDVLDEAAPRMSRWLQYDSGSPDRVAMGGGTYVAQNGYAFSLDIEDPDHTGVFVTYRSRGKLGDHDLNISNQRVYQGATPNDSISVRYLEQPQIQVDTTDGNPRSFGSIQLEKRGAGACILNNNRLQIEVTMTRPYYGLRVIRGYVMANATACNLASYPTPNVRFDSITFTLQGSLIRLLSLGGTAIDSSPTAYVPGPPPGFDAQLLPAASGATTTSELLADMGSPEPRRLLIKSTGYGPRGAKKQLHAIIQKNFFNSLTAPATLTLIGPQTTTAQAACPTCDPATPAQPASTFRFAFGDSNSMEYSGQDAASTDIIPPIGAWGDGNVGTIFDEIDGHSPGTDRWNTVTGVPSDITADTPPWLSSPANLDEYVQMQYADAYPRGRYFPDGVQPDADADQPYPFGNYETGTGITICDGDCEFTGDGGGILIVTGKLTLRGNFNFKGIILVTGQGGVDRRGGGEGNIEGNMIIAPYVNSSILPETEPLASNFLAPQYDLSGGGNSIIRYNSNALSSALQAVDNFVLGVVEK